MGRNVAASPAPMRESPVHVSAAERLPSEKRGMSIRYRFSHNPVQIMTATVATAPEDALTRRCIRNKNGRMNTAMSIMEKIRR